MVDARKAQQAQDGGGGGGGGGVPAVPWPSDHLPLVSAFQFVGEDGAVVTETVAAADPALNFPAAAGEGAGGGFAGAFVNRGAAAESNRPVPQCKFGAACRYLQLGTCRNAHSNADEFELQNLQLGTRVKQCKFGSACRFLAAGTCRNAHD